MKFRPLPIACGAFIFHLSVTVLSAAADFYFHVQHFRNVGLSQPIIYRPSFIHSFAHYVANIFLYPVRAILSFAGYANTEPSALLGVLLIIFNSALFGLAVLIIASIVRRGTEYPVKDI